MTTDGPRARSRTGRAILVGTATAALALSAFVGAAAPSALGAPNPYGDVSIATTVTPSDDGSYRVQTRESRELTREVELGFGGGISDSFRLPDDQIPDDADTGGVDLSGRAPVIPAYLTAAYTMKAAKLDDQPIDLAFTRDRHRVQAGITGTYPEGEHVADFDYTVKGAAVTSSGDEEAYLEVHVRLLSGPPVSSADTVFVDESELSGSLVAQIECVTYAPDRVPCGAQREQGWTVDFSAVSDRSRTGDIVIILAVG